MVINGQRESVMMKANTAYETEGDSSTVNAANPIYHQYEDVDVEVEDVEMEV